MNKDNYSGYTHKAIRREDWVGEEPTPCYDVAHENGVWVSWLNEDQFVVHTPIEEPEPRKTTIEDLYRFGDVCYIVSAAGSIFLVDHVVSEAIYFGSGGWGHCLRELSKNKYRYTNKPLTPYEQATPIIA